MQLITTPLSLCKKVRNKVQIGFLSRWIHRPIKFPNLPAVRTEALQILQDTTLPKMACEGGKTMKTCGHRMFSLYRVCTLIHLLLSISTDKFFFQSTTLQCISRTAWSLPKLWGRYLPSNRTTKIQTMNAGTIAACTQYNHYHPMQHVID